MNGKVARPCPASGLRVGARFVVRDSSNQYVTTCPTCDLRVVVNVVREEGRYPLGPKFTRTISVHDRYMYLGRL